MLSRDEAMKALLARIRGATEAKNPDALLSPDAAREAEQLTALAHPEDDEQAAALLGLFHFGRYEALSEGEDQHDFALAVKHFAVLYRTKPEIVPLPIREHLDRGLGATEIHSDRAGPTERALAKLESYHRSGELTYLVTAVALFRDALAAASGDPESEARHLSNLGSAIRQLFEETGNVASLTEAVQLQRQAVAITAGSEGDHWMYQSNLCAVLGTLAGRTAGRAGVALLTEAVTAGRAAVAGAGASGADRGTALSALGSALVELTKRTGEEKYLREAVETHRAAADATPDGHPRRAAFLMNAANTMQELFEVTQDTAILTAAVDLSVEALAAVTDSDPDWPGFQASLGNALIRLAEHTTTSEPLAGAIAAHRKATAATSSENPYRAIYLSGLGSARLALAEHTEDTADFAEAVNAFRAAVAAAPLDHPYRCGLLFNLAGALKAYGEQSGDFRALTEAVYTQRAAVAGTDPGEADYPERLSGLGDALRSLSEHDDDPDLPEEARECFATVAGNAAGPTRTRIWAYRQLAQLSGPTAALEAMEHAVALLPRLTPAALTRSDRLHQLGRLAGIAGESAAAAVSAGQPERAAQLLEQTRGILIADSLHARSSELSRLRDSAPDLAREFETMRSRLELLNRPTPLGRDSASRLERQDLLMAAGSDTAMHREAQAEWELLIDRIRSTDGLGDFLLAPSASDLTAEAREGPVVFVYTSPQGCGAVALTSDPAAPVLAIPLDALTQDDARQHAEQFLRAHTSPSQAEMRAARNALPASLEWMWNTITEPVLTALGFTDAPTSEEWPRVWWCPVGILAFLPLHAAGHHGDLSSDDPELRARPRAVLDRVVSSYTSTIRSLSHSRRISAEAQEAKILIVSAPNVPGGSSLLWAADETISVASLMPGSQVLQNPDRRRVLESLADYPLAHFACHGYASWREPAASTLILTDHETSPLTVADIIEENISGTLAYLSACETTLTRLDLADEAVHLTGAFCLAGYQQVIGTLWPVHDKSARDVAVNFYTALSRDGITTPNAIAAASALHSATRQLRAQKPGTPSLWSSHIHTGI
jgi:hypothetical protein